MRAVAGCVGLAMLFYNGPVLPSEPAPAAFAQRVLSASDHAGMPFAIVDKQEAMLWVFQADGRLAGATPVLLGSTPGDHALPGVGERTQAGRLLAADKTTPAGRFVSMPGHNSSGEAVVWIDHADALAIHRVRAGATQAARLQRLASSRPQDRRVSAGCVVVPVAFYTAVVEPLLGRSSAVIYVLAEELPVPASGL